jgi:hypothetical protein
MKMEINFVNKSHDRFIKASIQEDQHPALKLVKIIFDKNANVLLLSLPPTGIKSNF